MSGIKVKTLISSMILFVFGIGLVVQTDAQTVRNPRRVERQMRDVVQRIRVDSDNFRASFENAVQTVRLRGTESDNINRYLDDYETALNDYDNRLQSRQDNVSDVRLVLDAATKINGWLRATRLGSRVDRDWTTVKTSLTQLARQYNLNWNGDFSNSTSNYPNNYPSNNYPNTSSNSLRLTGTFELDQSRSDNASDIADQTANSLPINQQESARSTLKQRLETPERLAIEQNGRQFTIASSRAPRYTFDADGRDKFETGDNNSNLRVRASLIGERLEVATSSSNSSNSGRGNDYNVIFELLPNGRSLRVTRRLTTDFISQAVVVTSIYERTAQTAQLDLYDNPNNIDPVNQPQDNNGSSTNSGNSSPYGYIVNNETKLQATLSDAISTKTANNNDRFTMIVQTPNEYRGAIIEGYLSGINRSGKVTGRAGLNFNFETIRLRDGKTYDFAGFVESIRNNNGDDIQVDNEGKAQGGNQTKQTATRGAVGAGLGALIGAIAGGGKGAAIGAIIGAGAGAGSVYVQGRDDLEINAGSEIYIRASAPNRSPR